MKSLAAILEAINQPLSIREIEVPDPGFGQVLVRVRQSGICGAQLQEISGQKESGPMPHPLGHEGVGLAVKTGQGVKHIKEGDTVVMHWRKGRGIECDTPRYRMGSQDITAGRVTTFCQAAIVSENRLTAVSSQSDPDLCSLLGCGLSTALGTIERDAALMFGESVMIIGVGGLGVNLIAAAKARGAGAIIAADVIEDKLELAKSVGADLFVNSAEDNVCSVIRYALGLSSVDVIIDTSGHSHVITTLMPLLAPSGRFIFVGHPSRSDTVSIKNADHLFEGEGKTLKATQGGGFNPSIDIPRYMESARLGRIKTSGIVSHRVPLENINEGIQRVMEGHASRVMIDTR